MVPADRLGRAAGTWNVGARADFRHRGEAGNGCCRGRREGAIRPPGGLRGSRRRLEVEPGKIGAAAGGSEGDGKRNHAQGLQASRVDRGNHRFAAATRRFSNDAPMFAACN
jgi:hypothetical protein